MKQIIEMSVDYDYHILYQRTVLYTVHQMLLLNFVDTSQTEGWHRISVLGLRKTLGIEEMATNFCCGFGISIFCFLEI